MNDADLKETLSKTIAALYAAIMIALDDNNDANKYKKMKTISFLMEEIGLYEYVIELIDKRTNNERH